MARFAASHPTPDQLRAFAEGALPTGDTQAVEAHLLDCQTCCETLSQQADGTLLELARDALAGTKNAQSDRVTAANDPNEIPAALLNHPRYRVLGKIGSGGMGAVYKAEHRLMQRLVALKVVHPWMLANPQAVARFQREVRMAARLHHPNIVTSFDAEDADGLHFLIMEFVPGVSLDRLLHNQAANKQSLPVDKVCDWMRQAALGLQFAHEQGMVHRDIKPQNLMLTKEGVVKILDFGLTRLVADSGGAQREQHAAETHAGMILGTPDYMAPEQVEDSRSADIRSDIYSLGCTFYELLLGNPPFPRGGTLSKLQAHASKGVPAISVDQLSAPAHWSVALVERAAAIVGQMTAKAPADRFQTPAEIARELAAIAKDARDQANNQPAMVAASNSPVPAVSVVPQISSTSGTAQLPQTIKSPQAPLLQAVQGTDSPTVIVSQGKQRQMLERSSAKQAWLIPIGGAVIGVVGLVLLLGALSLGGFFAGDGSNNNHRPVNAPPVVASASTQRILLLIPSRGLWYADYAKVVQAVKASDSSDSSAVASSDIPFEVVVAGTQLTPAALAEGSITGTVRPQILVGPQLKADDFGAILVVGYDTSEFVPGGPFDAEVKRLLRDFQFAGKPIASICAGQRILLEHDFARGKKVAPCEYIRPAAVTSAGAQLDNRSVVQDGNLLTASSDKEADAFVKSLKKMLRP